MKNIVVIGGSSGIGLAIIQNLTGNIYNISRTACPVSGVIDRCADVTDAKALKRAFGEITEIDTLIYCAGCSLAAPVEYMKDADAERVIDTNLVGALRCCKLALPLLDKSEDPRIIMLSSSAAIAPIAFDAVYSASKAGLVSLCAELRLENPRVKSTAVIIGGTKTQFSFKRKIYTDCAEYDKNLKSASDALIKIEQTGYSAEYTAKKIVALAQEKSPPIKYTVGIKNKLMLLLYTALPEKLQTFALEKLYDIKK